MEGIEEGGGAWGLNDLQRYCLKSIKLDRHKPPLV